MDRVDVLGLKQSTAENCVGGRSFVVDCCFELLEGEMAPGIAEASTGRQAQARQRHKESKNESINRTEQSDRLRQTAI